MSNFTFQILYPVWIGIGCNLLLTFFNVLSLGSNWGSFRRWYFDKNGFFWLMGIVWTICITWSVINGVRV